MKLLIAVLSPPLAVFRSRGRGPAVLNVALCLCGLLPGIVHAVAVVKSAEWNEWIRTRMTA